MARGLGIALAGGLLALCGGTLAFADVAWPAAAIPAAPRLPRAGMMRPVVGRAHLVFRQAENEPPLEGVVTVIQGRSADWCAAAAGVVMAPCPDPPPPESPPPASTGSPSAH